MKNELDYIQIEDGLGGNQDWFPEWDMYHGGCAAVTACDLCIYLALREDAASLYPYDLRHLNRRYRLGTWILAAMFATRRAVETPLYLAGATGPLGAARLALGVPLFALTLWLIWLLVGPAHHAAPGPSAP